MLQMPSRILTIETSAFSPYNSCHHASNYHSSFEFCKHIDLKLNGIPYFEGTAFKTWYLLWKVIDRFTQIRLRSEILQATCKKQIKQKIITKMATKLMWMAFRFEFYILRILPFPFSYENSRLNYNSSLTGKLFYWHIYLKLGVPVVVLLSSSLLFKEVFKPFNTTIDRDKDYRIISSLYSGHLIVWVCYGVFYEWKRTARNF